MKPSNNRHVDWFDVVIISLLLIVIVFAIIPGDAMASGGCNDGSCNSVLQDTRVFGGDNTAENSALIGGSRTQAFSHSLGDVDINDCLASTQWGTILVSRQKVVLNKWCAAEIYDHKGMYQMAAMMRCGIREIADHFQTESECIEANTVRVEVSRGTPDSAIVEHYEDLMSRLDELESQNNELQAEYDALEQRRQVAARRAREENERDRQIAQDALTALEEYQ